MLPGNETQPGREIAAAFETGHGGRECFNRQCGQRANARHCLQSPRFIGLCRDFSELCRLGVDPGRLVHDLFEQVSAFLTDQLGQIAVRFYNELIDAREMSDTLRDDETIFVENSTQRVHQFGALMNKAFAGPKQHCPGLLFFRSRLDETHLRTLCCNYNRLGVGCVVLLSLSERVFIYPLANGSKG